MYPVHGLVFLKSFAEEFSDTVMTYDYPYQSAVSNDRIRSCNFMLPLDDQNTRVFSIQLWKGFKVPGLRRELSTPLMNKLWIPLVRHWTLEVFRQDGATVDRWEKQLAYTRGEIDAMAASAGTRVKPI